MVVVLIKRLRKALKKLLMRQTLENQWNFNKWWEENTPSRGPALVKVSQCQAKQGHVQEKCGVVETWHFWEKVMEDDSDCWDSGGLTLWSRQCCEDLWLVETSEKLQLDRWLAYVGQCHLPIIMEKPTFFLSVCMAATMLEALSLVFTMALQSRWGH